MRRLDAAIGRDNRLLLRRLQRQLNCGPLG